MNRILNITLLALLATLDLTSAFAQDGKKSSSTRSANVNSPTWKSFTEMRRRYRLGELNDSEMWKELVTLNDSIPTLPAAQQASILQTQASVLNTGGYPILAAINAAQALRRASQPLDEEFKRSWTILREVSRQLPIQNLVESVAEDISLGNNLPPAFGTEWKYIEGNVLAKNKKTDQAIAAYGSVKVTDRYFFPAKYQQGMLYLDLGKNAEAIAAMKAIIYPTSQDLSSLSNIERTKITADANMALGRIYYEMRQFSLSTKHYRMIDRTSDQFYDALFEQSWSLFMAGFPNHALGTLHSVRSPFFKETFNPEATMLASIIYYWMCRYNDSRNELADFLEYHQGPIKALSEFLDRKALTDETAYNLFENTVTGVSSEGLGMPRTLLNSAAQQDSMMHVRDQYASVLTELQRLELKGVFGNKENIATPRSYLDQWSNTLKADTGRRFLTELREMRREFERLHDQAQFLYLELLMSQKDQLLGKEFHGSSKIDKLSRRENIAGWGQQTQAWASDDKMEYWQDELGFHIFRTQPLCKTQ